MIHLRHETVDGVGPWHWVEQDRGAWDGPKQDWETSHKHKYFNHVKNWNIAVCAGGNQGMYPKMFAKRFSIVYTFEPDPLNFHVLNLNCAEDNIIALQCALGATNDFVAITRHSFDNCGMHRIEGSGAIPQLALDSFNFPHMDFIQLDVEGYELNVIRGASQTIQKFHPVITCERPSDELIKLLGEWGYELDDQSIADSIFVYRD